MAMVPQTGLRGGGVVVAVIGPPLAGKSSLIAAARECHAGKQQVVFAVCIVSQPAPDQSSGGRAVGARDFEAIRQSGGLALTWRAEGVMWGLPSACDDEIARGRVIVVETVHEAIARLRQRYRRVHVVHVTADRRALSERRRALGREAELSGNPAVARVGSSNALSPPATTIENSGALADAVDQFLEILSNYVPEDRFGGPRTRSRG